MSAGHETARRFIEAFPEAKAFRVAVPRWYTQREAAATNTFFLYKRSQKFTMIPLLIEKVLPRQSGANPGGLGRTPARICRSGANPGEDLSIWVEPRSAGSNPGQLGRTLGFPIFQKIFINVLRVLKISIEFLRNPKIS